MNPLLLKDHLEKLYPFKIMADLKGVGAAARSLGLTQSGLSHCLKTLEEILQVQLINRHSKGISLTQEGEMLYEFSRKLFHLTDDAELRIRNCSKVFAGRFRIATHETLATHVWPPFIQKVATLYPELEISLISGRVDPIMQDLLNGNVDLALTVEPLDNPRLHKVPIYQGEFGLYVSSDHEKLGKYNILKKKKIRLDEIEGIPVLTDYHAHIRQGLGLPQFLGTNGFKFDNAFQLNSFEAAINLAENGLGICIIPKRNAKAAVDAGKIRELKIDGQKSFGEYNICASFLKGTPNEITTKIVEEFLSYHSITRPSQFKKLPV